jgi:predicted transcriptional regulator
MKQYTITLDDEQAERLQRMAATEMKSEEQLLRDLIARYAVESGHERVFAMQGVVDGPEGSFADVPEDEYLKGFGE